jgi:hypothetical protein
LLVSVKADHNLGLNTLFLDIYSIERHKHGDVPIDKCQKVFAAALFKIAQTGSNPNISTAEWINRIFIHWNTIQQWQ